MYTSILTAFVAVTIVHAYSIPTNLQTIYNNHKPGKCINTLQGGFSHGEDSDTSFAYCGDLSNAIYIHSEKNSGQYADMDVDCDGANNEGGKCANDPSGQSITAFQDTIQSYKAGISDLDANIHPYCVFGNEGDSPSFRPQDYGIQPLSVMAIVCNSQLVRKCGLDYDLIMSGSKWLTHDQHYCIWGDTNGGTTVGESSMALADLCFPDEDLSGDNGHEGFDVMYIAFQNGVGGINTAPGKNGAKWNAASTKEFEDSIKGLGDQLVAQLQ